MTLDILDTAKKVLEKHPLCNHCLGRQFALLGYGVDNEKRGEALKLILTMKAHRLATMKNNKGVTLLKTLASNGNYAMATEILKRMKKKANESQPCHLCQGRLESIEELTTLALDKLKEYEYKTTLVGVELPVEVEEREDEVKGEFTVKHGESLRNEFSRIIGKRIAEATGKQVEYERPEIVVLINPFTGHVYLQVNPLHIGGRYRKLVRDIPQSRWLCSNCRGKGCKNCNWTGKMYPESVEEIVGYPALKMTQGEDIAFHGAGREDIDARMLGSGRPFVIEVKKPRKRFINLRNLKETINAGAKGKVEVSDLYFADKDVVRKLKRSEEAQKRYRATVKVDKRVSEKQLTALRDALKGTLVKQQTPKRVMHRRADMIREKYIYEANVKRLTPNRFELEIRCQGGLYIKELITGDDGRTVPSVAQILGVKAVPAELDVLGVYMEDDK
ncbi:MAG TPA: tRNA pseudouridine(54/55) synthase Pus10 [Candidatus Bathyarchaeia archaeon]|nr:tRNA pseudouridine(54/55) synthase Pus10 [Candidatus Bathyarchaeia archaeon]